MGAETVRFLVLWMGSWLNSRQLEAIDFPRKENRVLHGQLGERRPWFTDDQRRLVEALCNVGRHTVGGTKTSGC